MKLNCLVLVKSGLPVVYNLYREIIILGLGIKRLNAYIIWVSCMIRIIFFSRRTIFYA